MKVYVLLHYGYEYMEIHSIHKTKTEAKTVMTHLLDLQKYRYNLGKPYFDENYKDSDDQYKVEEYEPCDDITGYISHIDDQKKKWYKDMADYEIKNKDKIRQNIKEWPAAFDHGSS